MKYGNYVLIYHEPLHMVVFHARPQQPMLLATYAKQRRSQYKPKSKCKNPNILVCGGLWSKPWMILHQNVGAYWGIHFSIAGLYFLLLAKYFSFWNNIHF